MGNTGKTLGNSSIMIPGMFLLVTLFVVTFFHRGSGIIRETRQKGDNLYFHMSNGHIYEASKCKEGQNQGNSIRYIAIGPDLMLWGERIVTPIIVYCEFGGWVDDVIIP